jgi:pyridoxamine 5'-phosphate oxidase
MNSSELRNEYANSKLTKESVDSNPVIQFQKWFDEALKAEILEPNAMILSTADELQPTQRTILLKFFDKSGFVFYTNYKSNKSSHIQQKDSVSLLFPWYELKRQVAITGKAEKISSLESAKYFISRPYGSQLGAWISHQSSVISSRSLMVAKYNEMKQKFKEGKVPVPDFWGGYRVIPSSFEFWQSRPNRLHDRIFYKKINTGWTISMLSP